MAGIPVLEFRLEERSFAVEVAAVGQVLEARGIWPLPASPPWLLGALVARTRIVPVLDLRPILGLPSRGTASLKRVVVVEHAGAACGVAVSALVGRRDVSAEEVAPPQPGPFKWATTDGLAIIDLDALAPPADGLG